MRGLAYKPGIQPLRLFMGRGVRLPELLLAIVMGLPLIALAVAAIAGLGADSALSSNMLPVSLRDTGWLLLEVGLATAVLGLLSAWLVTHFEFPGRAWLDWALVLPLAVPTYLSAYTWVEFADFSGPLQTALRAMTGAGTVRDYWFPQIRSTGGAAFVMSLVLYPYGYLTCRAFFLMQSRSLDAAARTLGAGSGRGFFAITLPLARPAIVVGVTLSLMEVINDLGAVQYFGVNSLTALIYSTWINRSNFAGAAQLSVTIVLLIGLLIWLEQLARHRGGYVAARDNRTPAPLDRLDGWRALTATAFAGGLVALGFGVPLFELVSISVHRLASFGVPAAMWPALGNTVGLGMLGAVSCVVIGLFTAKRLQQRRGASASGLIRLATLGYAMPGTVLAIGLLWPLGAIDLMLNRATQTLWDWTPGLILSGSFFALVYVYSVRFLAVSHSNIEAGIKKRGNSVLDAARVLGASRLGVMLKVDLPTLSPAILAAATLVFVECVKELPATLLLRPLGVETLSTLVYSEASAELFDAAAIPALLIIFAGLVPVILSSRLSGRHVAALPVQD
jgi:iron(III) transport system permease protein